MSCLYNSTRKGKMTEKRLFSAILHYKDNLPYPREDFEETVKSVFNQKDVSVECIIVDHRGKGAKKDYLPEALAKKVKAVPGDFKNRAEAINAGLSVSKGQIILIMDNISTPIIFAKCAFEIYGMVLERDAKVGLIYADYLRINPDGSAKDVQLLEYHEGRLRDMFDMGSVYCCKASAVKAVRGMSAKYNAADLYDLRFKISEKYKVKHVSNRYKGSLYTIKKQAAGHDVFAYLLASKDVQLEMEDAVTQHLKRIGAYLAPGQNFHKVRYTPEEEKKFKDCIASVVIPVNNRPEFISDAIKSVQAQAVRNVEVIVVVNGGETDPTIDAVKEYMEGGPKYNPQKPKVSLIVSDVNNIGYCLNKGIRTARGKYYVQLDSDDQLTRDAVEKLLEVFNSDPTIGMVIGSYEVWQKEADGTLKRRDDIPVVTHDEWTFENGRNNLLRINGAGAPRSAHIKIIAQEGWFGVNDSPYSRNYGEDYDLVHRISERWNIGRVWVPIYKVVRHSGSTDHSIDQETIDRNDNAKDNMRIEAVERRKAINAVLKAKEKPKAQKTKKKKK